ncbi:hypothetical protein PXH59_00210 (plasmid) [Xenorhabdus sp. SF857]|uniref:hypothetical protein n=1 Tax=Xenorhabdus bakwenae TaxID=3026967 RepID=UPI002557EE1A|nr:hypothetical protein [Xenorhabdus sp. SF857]WFQ78105.1 hypothetical protein PXH59_00210 [Xenorhabdus sp. SF857]
MYEPAISEYGIKASQADILAHCARTWTDYQSVINQLIEKDKPEAISRHQVFHNTKQGFQELIEDKADKLGDNRQEINRWVREFIIELEKKLLDESEIAKRIAANNELEELKKNPAFKALPNETEKAFSNIGVIAKYNYKDVTIPRNGRYRIQTLGAFQYFFLQDNYGKAGKVFSAKDILKNRFGAKFCVGEGDWQGSWWYFPASVDVQEVFEIIS